MTDIGIPPGGLPRPIPAPSAEPEALLRRFVFHHGDKYRYVPAWGRWMAWNGKVWRPDDRGIVVEALRALCREALAETGVEVQLERRARTLAELQAEAEEWDRDPWLLNTPKGSIDLKTGQAHENRNGNGRFTKMTGTAMASALDRGKPRVWQDFLHNITGGDAELVGYLKRLCGYILTGTAVEQALFFIEGPGANGKSVFLNTLFAVLGDYALPVPSAMFLRGTREPKALAELRGVRLAAAQEFEPGARWAEARLKRLTGGDRVALPRSRGALAPETKFLLIGNQLPDLATVDEAMRRRLHVIPFRATVSREERDPWFLEKILAESAWVLMWMVEGCLEWQRHGLGYPTAVREASEQYLEIQDALGAWLGTCCVDDPDARTAYAELNQSWQAWAKTAGEPAGTPRALYKSLTDRGYRRHRSNGIRELVGIAVRPHAESCIRSVTSVTEAPHDHDPKNEKGVFSVTSVTEARSAPLRENASVPATAENAPPFDAEEPEDLEFGLVGYRDGTLIGR